MRAVTVGKFCASVRKGNQKKRNVGEEKQEKQKKGNERFRERIEFD